MSSAIDLTWRAAVEANLQEARKRRGRLGLKKSRGGCLTCKTRHIRCDKANPCRNCTSTGRQCGYAGAVTTSRQRSEDSTSLIQGCLANNLNPSNDEMRTFSYFLSHTAPRLAQNLDKDFWCGHVLQIAHQEPLVMDSLLALSTLYEHPQFMKSFHLTADAHNSTNGVHPSLLQRPIEREHVKALKHYNRAISQFQKKMHDGSATPLLAMLTCTLFICIEIIRDNIFGGVSLFITGATLMRQFSSCPEGMSCSLYDAIRQIFARLAVSGALMGHPAEHDVEEWAGKSPHDAGAFSNIAEARNMLFRLLGESHATLRLANCHRREALSRGTSGGIPAFANNTLDDYDFDDLPPPPPRPYELPENGYTTNMGTWSADLYEPNEDDGNIQREDQQHDYRAVLGGVSEDLYDLAWEHGDITAQQRSTMKLGDRNFPCDDQAIHDRRLILLSRLKRWHKTFKRIHSEEDEVAASLLMHYQFAITWLQACPIDDESAFDNWTQSFKEILRLSEIFLAKSEHSTFTFEVGTVPALAFVAGKCRVTSVRRKALSLLSRAPSKESMWCAQSVGEVLARLITIEEEGLGLPPPLVGSSSWGYSGDLYIDDSVLPPEEQRVHVFGIRVNKTAGRYDIRITRYFVDVETGARVKVLSDHPI
ncbi:hypothetical protein CB0940_07636 [Cercospora beticola]|uniref:Zn(2)-C6 fungal-type domain-containing protein n=1 Tax=Cercospora beticola TaxID=122368 RepID=A0A2G5HAZ7_CERBT|nr:hypothetical protein CB0940_07636 [Cercospora beticola]PIA89422.1 hypothetical protein CB0940_07636 [Cercospora beticola]WPB03602.1 hypothetical protein RHO25_008242 [Cercospora beticola]